jgi:hypothetical protein
MIYVLTIPRNKANFKIKSYYPDRLRLRFRTIRTVPLSLVALFKTANPTAVIRCQINALPYYEITNIDICTKSH